MSFVRVGNYFFRKSKIVYVNVSSSGLFGNNYALNILYDMPRPGDFKSPTTDFQVYYDKRCLKQLLLDVNSVVSNNDNCIIGSGAATLLGYNKSRE